jgi:vacuolar iron transporter family protein
LTSASWRIRLGRANAGKKGDDMKFGLILRRLRRSFGNSAGTIVFGMEDGTVSIFGLIFGVAATTNNPKTVLIAGASGAVAAAVSMMAGAYLDIETTRDKAKASRLSSAADAVTSLPPRLAKAGLSPQQSQALTVAVKNDPEAVGGLLLALDGAADAPLNPGEQALWMLFADFLAAAVPIVPFVVLPVPQARFVSAAMTIALLIGLGIGRSRVAKRDPVRTVLETVAIGVAAAMAGVGISVLIDRFFS